MTEEIVGIDLGTTNSEIAVYLNGRPEILADEHERKILPSVVGVTEAGELLVGEEARNQLLLYPERTIRSIKRRMGQPGTVPMAGQDYTPQEISAIILKRLKSIAEARVGRERPQGGHHGARVFLRRPAPGDPRGRRNRRAGGGAHNQRTHRCRTGVRSRAARGQAHPGL